jgi:uracil-DNA glycosylase
MSQSVNVQIEDSWKVALADEFQQPYFQSIKEVLLLAKQSGKTIYPPGPLIFNAFNLTPLPDVKVVILGQDPYHNAGQAMGLSFSVPRTEKTPPSLKNIYKELKEDVAIEIPSHGDLSEWAAQGVLMLNAMLTVEANLAGSHKDIGWQKFTDAVIKKISDEQEGVVFLLWGNFAKTKGLSIDTNKHFVLDAAHPSPLAGGKFFGCKHFSQTNALLEKQGKTPINWQV